MVTFLCITAFTVLALMLVGAKDGKSIYKHRWIFERHYGKRDNARVQKLRFVLTKISENSSGSAGQLAKDALEEDMAFVNADPGISNNGE